MIIPPPKLIISLFSVKKLLSRFTEFPKIKKVVDIPIVKNIVFLNNELFIKSN